MEKFTEELNRFTDNKYEFMLKSALYNQGADFCLVEILYKDGILLSPDEKKRIQDFALSFLPKELKFEFSFIKNLCLSNLNNLEFT